MHALLLVLAISMIALSCNARAVDNSCLDDAATQRALNYCADSVRLQSTQLLKKLMGELHLREDLTAEEKDKLSQIHQVWYESVDLDCKWKSSSYKRSTQFPYILHNCWTEKILQRVEWLAPSLCPKGQTECMISRQYINALPYNFNR